MNLKSKTFGYAYELANYVNNKRIQKENIQQIISINGVHYLFYWE